MIREPHITYGPMENKKDVVSRRLLPRVPRMYGLRLWTTLVESKKLTETLFF